MDLTWYFNQWYFGNGHPKLDIQYKYNEGTKQATVIVKQTQGTGKIFRIPTFIDVYNVKKELDELAKRIKELQKEYDKKSKELNKKRK